MRAKYVSTVGKTKKGKGNLRRKSICSIVVYLLYIARLSLFMMRAYDALILVILENLAIFFFQYGILLIKFSFNFVILMKFCMPENLLICVVVRKFTFLDKIWYFFNLVFWKLGKLGPVQNNPRWTLVQQLILFRFHVPQVLLHDQISWLAAGNECSGTQWHLLRKFPFHLVLLRKFLFQLDLLRTSYSQLYLLRKSYSQLRSATHVLFSIGFATYVLFSIGIAT